VGSEMCIRDSMEMGNIYYSNNINYMRIKKEIPVDQDIIDYVTEKYPGVPFTKWAAMAFRKYMEDDPTEIPNTDNTLIEQRLDILEEKIDKFINGFKDYKERNNTRLNDINGTLEGLGDQISTLNEVAGL
jgi:hypothetical protein